MKAAVLRSGRLVIDSIQRPAAVANGKVVVKTLVCGICGSDLHAADHGAHTVEMSMRAGANPETLWDPAKDLVFGHEFCAEIIEHGPGTTKALKPGTRVCSVPFSFGPYGVEWVGLSNRAGGGFGEYMTLEECFLLPVPNGLSSDLAALVEPTAVGVHAVNRADVAEGDVALVLGCGPIGLAVIAALRAKKNITVIACDYSPERRVLASKLGADIVVDPKTHSPYEKWNELQVPAGLNDLMVAQAGGQKIRRAVIFECVGLPNVLQQVIAGAPVNATIVVAGVCMEKDAIEPVLAILKQLDIRFALAYSPEEFSQTLNDIAEGVLRVDAMITGKIVLDDVPGEFEKLKSDKTQAKVLITYE